MSGQDYEQLTLFPADSPASPSPLPGSVEARRMTVTSGLKCSESLENCGPVGSLVRMLLESSIWRSTQCSLTWKKKDMRGGRCLYRLAASTRRTGASAAQFWPTVTSFDATCGELKGREYTGTQHAMKIGQAVRMLPTPRANCSTGASWAPHRQGAPDLQTYAAMFPPPRSSDAKLTGPPGSASAEHDLKRRQLRGVVLYPTPTTERLCGGSHAAARLKEMEAAGQITPEERRSMQAGNGGQLNPDWVEWLMGYPIGWSSV